MGKIEQFQIVWKHPRPCSGPIPQPGFGRKIQPPCPGHSTGPMTEWAARARFAELAREGGPNVDVVLQRRVIATYPWANVEGA